MVCVAAFVILAVVALSLPVIRLLNRKLAASIWGLFRKSASCVGRRVTLRKCDSSFKEDAKNSILRKVVLKRPKWVKPLSIIIETTAVLIVAVSVWSLLVAAKSGLALYVYGTCNLSQPSVCALTAVDACGIDREPIYFKKTPLKWTGNWFAEFGEIIGNIPARVKKWNAVDYIPTNARPYNDFSLDINFALDIIDPCCPPCMRSFQNELEDGFFDNNDVYLMPYPIRNPDGSYKLANSYLLTAYIEAVRLCPLTHGARPAEWLIIEKLFTEKNDCEVDYQTAFNTYYSEATARETMQGWLAEFGYTEDAAAEIEELTKSTVVAEIIERNIGVMNNEIKARKLPARIHDGKRHYGVYK